MTPELVLIRSSSDLEAVTAVDETEKPKINIEKLHWRVPHVSVGIPQQLALTKLLVKNVEILVPFRSGELVEYSALPQTTRHNWPVKTTTKLETPRHVIVALHTDKKNKMSSNMSKFNDCNFANIRVFLNSERYPYHDLFLDFKANKFATLYDMFANFRKSFNELEKS